MKKLRKHFKLALSADPQLNRRAAGALGIFLLAWMILGGNKGLVSAYKTWSERSSLQAEISRLEQANKDLSDRKQNLIQNPQLYEKVAREDLALARPGEIIYRFEKSPR